MINYLWDFQLNTEVARQSYEDQLLLNQKEVLNAFCENEEESSLNILLEEVLTVNAINNTAIIGDKTNRILGY